MYIVDDPTLALLVRFAGDDRSLNLSDAEFLFKQLEAIEEYVSHYSAEERQARAMEWVEMHAREYRQRWQKRAAFVALSRSRCTDCPLVDDSSTEPCAVHKHWLDLLRRYATDDLSDHDYIHDALSLLDTHRDRLKVGRSRRCSPDSRTELMAG